MKKANLENTIAYATLMLINANVDDSTVILDDRYNPQEYGIASKKDNTELAKVINEVINEMKSSGEIDKLIKKWEIK